MNAMDTIVLGQKVTDPITGFTGTATAKTEYIDGNVNVLVEPQGMQESGAPLQSCWINQQRLRIASEVPKGNHLG